MTIPTLEFPKFTINQAACDGLPTIWVQNDDDLYALIDEIDASDVVALDTELSLIHI